MDPCFAQHKDENGPPTISVRSRPAITLAEVAFSSHGAPYLFLFFLYLKILKPVTPVSRHFSVPTIRLQIKKKHPTSLDRVFFFSCVSLCLLCLFISQTEPRVFHRPQGNFDSSHWVYVRVYACMYSIWGRLDALLRRRGSSIFILP